MRRQVVTPDPTSNVPSDRILVYSRCSRGAYRLAWPEAADMRGVSRARLYCSPDLTSMEYCKRVSPDGCSPTIRLAPMRVAGTRVEHIAELVGELTSTGGAFALVAPEEVIRVAAAILLG